MRRLSIWMSYSSKPWRREVRRRPRQHQRAGARGVVEHRLGHERPADRDAVEAGRPARRRPAPRTSARSRRRAARRTRRRSAPRSTRRAARPSGRSGASPRRTPCRCAGRTACERCRRSVFSMRGASSGRIARGSGAYQRTRPFERRPVGPSGSSPPRTHGGGSPARARRPAISVTASSARRDRRAARAARRPRRGWPMLATNPTASTSRSAISGGRRGSSGSAPKAVANARKRPGRRGSGARSPRARPGRTAPGRPRSAPGRPAPRWPAATRKLPACASVWSSTGGPCSAPTSRSARCQIAAVDAARRQPARADPTPVRDRGRRRRRGGTPPARGPSPPGRTSRRRAPPPTATRPSRRASTGPSTGGAIGAPAAARS